MSVKVICLLLLLMLVPQMALAGVVDDARKLWQDIKDGIKGLFVAVVQAGSVILIGWLFSFMVDPLTAKMMRLLIVICGINVLIRLVWA